MEDFKLYKSAYFPLKKRDRDTFKYEVIVGVGGNKGDVKRRFRNLLRFWLNDRRLKVVQTSPIFENPPFGFLDQANFFNAVVKVRTSLSPQRFLGLLLHTEKRFKRTRSFKNAPRTLDLDIILFNEARIDSKHLKVPHPCWQERLSVLVPLIFME